MKESIKISHAEVEKNKISGLFIYYKGSRKKMSIEFKDFRVKDLTIGGESGCDKFTSVDGIVKIKDRNINDGTTDIVINVKKESKVITPYNVYVFTTNADGLYEGEENEIYVKIMRMVLNMIS